MTSKYNHSSASFCSIAKSLFISASYYVTSLPFFIVLLMTDDNLGV